MALIDRLKALLGMAPDAPAQEPESGPLSCRQALAVVQEFLDGELDHVSQAQVKAHFDVCTRCYPHLRLEESFRAALQRASLQETAPPGLRSRVEALLSRNDEG